MNSSITHSFRKLLDALPQEAQDQARKQYQLWRRNHQHPSLHFKKVGEFWSARVDDGHRVLGRAKDDTIYWFWIGNHREYERIIRQSG